MQNSKFIGRGVKVISKVDTARFAKIVNPTTPVTLSPETMLNNLVAQKMSAQRYRQHLIKQGLLTPV